MTTLRKQRIYEIAGSGILDTLKNSINSGVNMGINSVNGAVSSVNRGINSVGRSINSATNALVDKAENTFTYERYPGERHARQNLIGKPYSFVGQQGPLCDSH